MKFARSVLIVPALLALGTTSWWASANTGGGADSESAPRRAATAISIVPGMPAVPDPSNAYSETVAGRFSPAVEGALERIYVPNRASNSVSVIDPATLKVIETFKVGRNPQHVVPSWDLRTLWVANNAEGTTAGSLTPIDPKTGKPGPSIAIDDPYNMYWSPDGKVNSAYLPSIEKSA